MHLETTVPQKMRKSSLEACNKRTPGTGARLRSRPPCLSEVGRRQTLNVFSADGRDVSAEAGTEEAFVDENDFLREPTVVFTRGKKGLHYTVLLLDYHKREGHPPHHRLHWLVTDIPGEGFSEGDVSGGSILADFEPPRAPRVGLPRLYVLMVFEQREVGQPLGCHPDLCTAAHRQRHRFPLTAWLRCNGPKMARIAACQQFRAHLAETMHVGTPDQCYPYNDHYQADGSLGDVEDSEESEEEQVHDHDDEKENQQTKVTRKGKSGKMSRLRRLLLLKKKQRSLV